MIIFRGGRVLHALAAATRPCHSFSTFLRLTRRPFVGEAHPFLLPIPLVHVLTPSQPLQISLPVLRL